MRLAHAPDRANAPRARRDVEVRSHVSLSHVERDAASGTAYSVVPVRVSAGDARRTGDHLREVLSALLCGRGDFPDAPFGRPWEQRIHVRVLGDGPHGIPRAVGQYSILPAWARDQPGPNTTEEVLPVHSAHPPKRDEGRPLARPAPIYPRGDSPTTGCCTGSRQQRR